MRTLTPRMEAFIDNVLRGMNHTDAAMEAGFAHAGNPSAYAGVLYEKLLPEIEARRLKAVAAATIEVDLSLHRTILETYHHAHYDPRCVVTWGPDGIVVKDSAALTPEQARLVKRVKCKTTEHTNADGETTRTTITEVDLVDRQLALHRMAEYQGLTAGDPNLGGHVPDAAAAKAGEDAQAAHAKLVEEIRDVPDAELLRRWTARRAVATASDRLPVPA